MPYPKREIAKTIVFFIIINYKFKSEKMKIRIIKNQKFILKYDDQKSKTKRS
jgi:hypothetical protein